MRELVPILGTAWRGLLGWEEGDDARLRVPILGLLGLGLGLFLPLALLLLAGKSLIGDLLRYVLSILLSNRLKLDLLVGLAYDSLLDRSVTGRLGGVRGPEVLRGGDLLGWYLGGVRLRLGDSGRSSREALLLGDLAFVSCECLLSSFRR